MGILNHFGFLFFRKDRVLDALLANAIMRQAFRAQKQLPHIFVMPVDVIPDHVRTTKTELLGQKIEFGDLIGIFTAENSNGNAVSPAT
uniref:Uncharacterized protein n=1 Tax=Magnetospirillum gryphiswaldense TaxID=55518 RepID=A4U254_9PROT|nr:hypothetical protein MGR_0680 [Magnetospirillum gryphiswaldense MSR-1]